MTSLNIVAHPDDDLLFLNPDIAEELERGEKPTIVYLTAGDDGQGKEYIERRLQASEAAYGKGPVKLKSLGIRSSSFRNGNVEGDLYRMWHGPEYVTLDMRGQETGGNTVRYHLIQLITSLAPNLIRVQEAWRTPALTKDLAVCDHVDHIYGAKFAVEVARQFPYIPVWAYMGYPVRYQPPNLSAHQIELKTKMWRAYQSIDTSVAGEQWDVALSRCYKERVQ